jgi:rubrerythrin
MSEMTVKKAIETAIKAEELGITFYSELAKKFLGNQELKTIFELLAKDEIEHKRQFGELLKGINVDSPFNKSDSAFMAGIDLTSYFPALETVNMNLKPSDILRSAFDFEKDSVLYYSAIKDVIGSNPVIDEIIRMEKLHMTQLFKYISTDSKFRGLSDSWD